MPECLIDTNVAMAANFKATVSDECALRCIQALREVTTNRRLLVVDDLDLIFTEYRNNLSLRGQPGVGDAFMKWVNDHRYDATRCTRIPITPTDQHNTDFSELASYTALTSFDPSDKKFLATAVAHEKSPPILVACDTDYWDAKETLRSNGINIEFLCQDDIKRLSTAKKKRRK